MGKGGVVVKIRLFWGEGVYHSLSDYSLRIKTINKKTHFLNR